MVTIWAHSPFIRVQFPSTALMIKEIIIAIQTYWLSSSFISIRWIKLIKPLFLFIFIFSAFTFSYGVFLNTIYFSVFYLDLVCIKFTSLLGEFSILFFYFYLFWDDYLIQILFHSSVKLIISYFFWKDCFFNWFVGVITYLYFFFNFFIWDIIYCKLFFLMLYCLAWSQYLNENFFNWFVEAIFYGEVYFSLFLKSFYNLIFKISIWVKNFIG